MSISVWGAIKEQGLPALAITDRVTGFDQPYIPKCEMDLVVDNQNITGPYKSIPTARVTSWSVSGETKTDTSGKVAATVAFGLIGFLVSDPKKHDYQLVVNGYDIEGEKTFINLRFKDGK